MSHDVQSDPSHHADAAKHDATVAIRNGVRLALSMLATWTVALAVRFQLPRHLGPEVFGRYNFCDAFTGTFFTFLTFGVSTYIMREIPIRPKHASDFFGGLLLVRTVLGGLSLLAIAGFLALSGKPSELQPLVLVFGLFHFISGVNGYLSSMLQASTKVGALASVNVIAKLLWGGGLLAALWLNAPLYVIALPNVASELIKLVVLLQACRRAVDLDFKVDMTATRTVLLASLPFYANGIAVELGSRVDVTMLEFLAPGPEVGWYSAANNFASLAIMLSPVIGWVVMPMLARAYARAEDEFFSMLRKSLRALLLLAIPGALTIALGADVWVSLAFGKSFGPAIDAVRVLAFMFVGTYAAILLSTALIILQRSWTLTVVSFISLGVELLLIPLGVSLLKRLGDGGAANGAALGFAGAELTTVVILLWSVGKRALDTALVSSVLKCAFVSVLTLLLHNSLEFLGPVRLALDLLFYAGGVFLLRAVSWSETVGLIDALRNRGKAQA